MFSARATRLLALCTLVLSLHARAEQLHAQMLSFSGTVAGQFGLIPAPTVPRFAGADFKVTVSLSVSEIDLQSETRLSASSLLQQRLTLTIPFGFLMTVNRAIFGPSFTLVRNESSVSIDVADTHLGLSFVLEDLGAPFGRRPGLVIEVGGFSFAGLLELQGAAGLGVTQIAEDLDLGGDLVDAEAAPDRHVVPVFGFTEGHLRATALLGVVSITSETVITALGLKRQNLTLGFLSGARDLSMTWANSFDSMLRLVRLLVFVEGNLEPVVFASRALLKGPPLTFCQLKLQARRAFGALELQTAAFFGPSPLAAPCIPSGFDNPAPPPPPTSGMELRLGIALRFG